MAGPAAVGPGAALLGLVLLLGACASETPGEDAAETEAASRAALDPAAAPEPAPPVEGDWPAAELRTGGGPVAAELGPGGSHVYRLPLDAGQFLRLALEQYDVDVALSLRDPAG
ncbi:MAG TPA: hypothetical protein VJG13_06595, partial [Thermoanaerobaculia bacterium]|nr:hypothetical protein [Thermoanaerobaculia bacterium]